MRPKAFHLNCKWRQKWELLRTYYFFFGGGGWKVSTRVYTRCLCSSQFFDVHAQFHFRELPFKLFWHLNDIGGGKIKEYVRKFIHCDLRQVMDTPAARPIGCQHSNTVCAIRKKGAITFAPLLYINVPIKTLFEYFATLWWSTFMQASIFQTESSEHFRLKSAQFVVQRALLTHKVVP